MDGPGKAKAITCLSLLGESPNARGSWIRLPCPGDWRLLLRPPLTNHRGAQPLSGQPAPRRRECEPQVPMVALQEEIRALNAETGGPGCHPRPLGG